MAILTCFARNGCHTHVYKSPGNFRGCAGKVECCSFREKKFRVFCNFFCANFYLRLSVGCAIFPHLASSKCQFWIYIKAHPTESPGENFAQKRLQKTRFSPPKTTALNRSSALSDVSRRLIHMRMTNILCKTGQNSHFSPLVRRLRRTRFFS